MLYAIDGSRPLRLKRLRRQEQRGGRGRSRSSVAFAQKGGTTTVAVATPSDWKVSCPDDWVTLASEEGLLTISATSNTTDNVRNSKITVETAGDKQEIAVHQAFSWETGLLSTKASEEI